MKFISIFMLLLSTKVFALDFTKVHGLNEPVEKKLMKNRFPASHELKVSKRAEKNL